MPPTWNDRTIAWYQWATAFCDYPGEVIRGHLAGLLRPGDAAIEAGAGTGVFSLCIAPLVRRVVAVDAQASCLKALERAAAAAGLGNIRTLAANWSDADVEPAEVTVSAYAPGITRHYQGVLKLAAKTRRTGLILTPRATVVKDDEIARAAQELGLTRSTTCANGCREVGWLESLGCEVSCRPVSHDLSQPVHDLDEAWGFLQYQTQAPDDLAPRAKEILRELLRRRDGVWYVPIIRHSCLVTFQTAGRDAGC